MKRTCTHKSPLLAPLCLLFLLPLCAHAQISLTAANMPQPGDIITLGSTLAFGIDVGTASAEPQVWDFSTLTPDEGEFPINYALPSASFPGAALFPDANLVGYRDSEIGSVYDYTRIDDQSLVAYGQAELSGFLGLSLSTFTPPITRLTFPVTYGNTGQQASLLRTVLDGAFFDADSVVILQNIVQTSVIDAHGTVILPSGSYATLRQSVQITIATSTYLFIDGVEMLVDESQGLAILYQWLSAESRGLLVLAQPEEESKAVYMDFFTFLATQVLAPVANFTSADEGKGSIQFTDLSTNAPDEWLWNFGDGATSTEQNPLHAYTMSGNYDVCLTASNEAGINTTCQMVAVMVTSAEEAARQLGLQVFPNPVSQVAHFTLPAAEGAVQVLLFNSLGQPVRRGILAGHLEIDVSQLPAGFYSYRLLHPDGRPLGAGRLMVGQ